MVGDAAQLSEAEAEKSEMETVTAPAELKLTAPADAVVVGPMLSTMVKEALPETALELPEPSCTLKYTSRPPRSSQSTASVEANVPSTVEEMR